MNNVTLSLESKNVLRFELGESDNYEKEYGIVDTRDTLENFRDHAEEFSGTWQEWTPPLEAQYGPGVRYFSGRIQIRKGLPRGTFLLIPQGDWNINYVSYDALPPETRGGEEEG